VTRRLVTCWHLLPWAAAAVHLPAGGHGTAMKTDPGRCDPAKLARHCCITGCCCCCYTINRGQGVGGRVSDHITQAAATFSCGSTTKPTCWGVVYRHVVRNDDHPASWPATAAPQAAVATQTQAERGGE
jgi:hypothetical protein